MEAVLRLYLLTVLVSRGQKMASAVETTLCLHLFYVYVSTTRQEVGLITGGPSSVWEFNQIHGVSYCVILKMAVNKKDQCCMGIQVNSRRQLYSLEFSIKYTLPYIYFNCFCLLCGYFPDPLLITFSALESEWNFHTTHTAKARNISGLL